MLGDKMENLANYLTLKGVAGECERFDYFAGLNQLLPCFSDLGDDQHLVARVRYPAVFYIERYSAPAELIFALVNIWLCTHDGDRERDGLPAPTFLPEQINEGDASFVNMEIEVEFQEDITIVPDENGLIDYMGKTYSIGGTTTSMVTEIEVAPK